MHNLEFSEDQAPKVENQSLSQSLYDAVTVLRTIERPQGVVEKSSDALKQKPQTDTPEKTAETMSPADLAASIIKNNGFGKGEDRAKADLALGKALEDALKNGTSAHDFAKQVNDELAKKGSTLKLDDQISGGGGKSGSKDNYNEHQEASGKFAVKKADGKVQDSLSIDASTDKVVESGKVVGEHSTVKGETGGGGGGWGKRGPERHQGFRLPEIILHDPFGIGGSGGDNHGGSAGTSGGGSSGGDVRGGRGSKGGGR